MKNPYLTPLIIIEGPTASGKSKFAFELAKLLDTEIISADSRQIYRFMNIGTAKPSERELKEVPHHLIDFITPDKEYSAGKFAKDATEAIFKMAPNKIPIVAGGSGFYIQSLLDGLFDAPTINNDIRQELDRFEQQKGSGNLYTILEKLDPEAAKKIHPNDSYRLKRALEVWIATGKGISSHWVEQQKNEIKYRDFRIIITEEREVLYDRINKRLEKMVEMGLIEEIKGLLAMGYKSTDPGLTSVGYKEFVPFLEGNCSFFDCLEEAKQNSRNYAKRQLTWYRRLKYDIELTSADVDVAPTAAAIRNYFEL